MELFELIQTLNRAHGPSGDEGEIREVIRALAEPYADEITADTMGSLIVHRRGKGPKLLLAAHMDSIGFVVTHIEKEGFLRVGRLGGVSPKEAAYTPVRFKSGQLVQVGDSAVYDAPAFRTGDLVVSPYLDDRISCAVLLSALERIGECLNDLYLVFTAQEEVGLRGARTAAWSIAPDYAVAVDVTDVDDTPGSERAGTARLGRGAAVKVMDSSVICHPAMVALLEDTAREGDIPVQRDIMRAGGTDAGAIHLTRTGVITGGISVPCRYIHTPAETASLSDADACVRLAAALAQRPLEQP